MTRVVDAGTSASGGNPRESVDWGDSDARRMNEWVTLDALRVLRAAGRLDVA